MLSGLWHQSPLGDSTFGNGAVVARSGGLGFMLLGPVPTLHRTELSPWIFFHTVIVPILGKVGVVAEVNWMTGHIILCPWLFNPSLVIDLCWHSPVL